MAVSRERAGKGKASPVQEASTVHPAFGFMHKETEAQRGQVPVLTLLRGGRGRIVTCLTSSLSSFHGPRAMTSAKLRDIDWVLSAFTHI